MSSGYKDFLSSPFFPRYGSLSNDVYALSSVNAGILTTLFDVTQRCIVKGFYIVLYTDQKQAQGDIYIIVDGNTLVWSLYNEGFTQSKPVDSILGIKAGPADPSSPYYSIVVDKDINVGSSFKVEILTDLNGTAFDVEGSLLYYPVE